MKKKLASAFWESADRIKKGSKYEWGHVGRCNCGHLVQTVCDLSDHEIYNTFGRELTEWSEHANDYCEVTGKPLEMVFDQLSELGFSRRDVLNLERLSDKRVLSALPNGRRFLHRNEREDVVLYMETMASLIEKEIIHSN
jgi:hypothetical protein